MKEVLTKVGSLGVVGIALLASCGSSDHFGVTPGGSEGSTGAGGVGEEDSGAIFQSPSGSGGIGQFAHGRMDGSVPFTDPDSGGTVLTPQSIDRCTMGAPSGLSAASLQALLAGGSAGSLRYLYPYAQTVFPRGLGSPTLMWDGGNADYVYVHIKSSLFEYKGCLAPTKAGQVLVPQDVWAAAGVHARGAADPFAVSLTLISGSTVTGPITEPIVIAPATLKGSVYYNTYSTNLLSTTSGGSGAVLRIEPGQTASVFLGQGGCTGCHAVSANGTRMVASPVGTGGTYVLTANTMPNPMPLVSNATDASFAGVSPDGKLYIGSAHPGGTGGPRSGSATNITNAALYETDTGNAVNGSGIPAGAMMPTFSPDGTQIVFTDSAINNGQGLATMTFDKVGRKASGYKKIFQASGSGSYPGWPFFLPDNKAVVFSAGSATDYSGSGVGLSFGGVVSVGLSGAPASDLFVVDVASGTSTILAQAMGFASPADVASNKTYLPFGASEEPSLPTSRTPRASSCCRCVLPACSRRRRSAELETPPRISFSFTRFGKCDRRTVSCPKR